MNTQPFVVAPRSYPDPLNVIGLKITVLAAKAATQGYEVTLQEGDEGYGPPPHSHDWDETFYVLKGNVEFTYGDQSALAAPGTLMHLPAGTVHSFRFGAGGGVMLEVAGQGTHASEMFTAIDRESPPGPPDIPKLITLLGRYGVRVQAPA